MIRTVTEIQRENDESVMAAVASFYPGTGVVIERAEVMPYIDMHSFVKHAGTIDRLNEFGEQIFYV